MEEKVAAAVATVAGVVGLATAAAAAVAAVRRPRRQLRRAAEEVLFQLLLSLVAFHFQVALFYDDDGNLAVPNLPPRVIATDPWIGAVADRCKEHLFNSLLVRLPQDERVVVTHQVCHIYMGMAATMTAGIARVAKAAGDAHAMMDRTVSESLVARSELPELCC